MSDTIGPILSRWSLVWQTIVDELGILMVEQAGHASTDRVQADQGLVSATMNGDGEAFGRIVEAYQDRIAVQMRRFSRDQTTIEELVHDTFVEAYLSLGTYRGQSPLIHWLRKVAVRVGYRYWKRRSKETTQTLQLSEIAESLDRLATGESITPIEASETIDGLLKVLSVRDRLVLTLLYWDECSIAEAAELSGWSQTMVKVQAHRARHRLRKLIEKSRK